MLNLKKTTGTERSDEFEKFDNKLNVEGEADIKFTGFFSSVMLVIKFIIAGGLLGLPYAFSESGWLLGLLTFPVITFLTGYCLTILGSLKAFCSLPRTTTPADLGNIAFGVHGKRLTNVIFAINCISVCVSQFMFITHNMEIVTSMRQEVWAAIFLVILVLLSFMRSMKLISYFAYVGNFCVFAGAVLLMIAAFVACEPSPKPRLLFNWREFPAFVGIVLYSVEAFAIILPVHNAMRDEAKLTSVVVVTQGTALVLYFTVGLVVYLWLGENSLAMITEAIDTGRFLWLQILLVVLFIGSLFGSILLNLFPLYEIADRALNVSKYRALQPEERMRILRDIEGVSESEASRMEPAIAVNVNASLLKNLKFWFLSTLGRAVMMLMVFIPSVTPVRHYFTNIMTLSSCTTGIVVSYIFPPAWQLCIQWSELPKWQKALDICLLIVSFPALVFFTVMSVINLVNDMNVENT